MEREKCRSRLPNNSKENFPKFIPFVF